MFDKERWYCVESVFPLYLFHSLHLQCCWLLSKFWRSKFRHPWRTLTVRALLCRAETVLNHEFKNLLLDLYYHSSHAGVDQCKQQSGTQLRCLDLSLGLSFDLSLICFSRDLMRWINPQASFCLSHRGFTPPRGFHLLHHHHLHQHFHIQFHLAWHLLHADLPCHAHRPN